MYQLDYLPIAIEDMTEIIKYISRVFCNPTAAESLSSEMIKAADRIKVFPYSNSVHFTIKPLKREYRKLIVQNYIMLYWVDEKEKCVTIARVIYARRDYLQLLEDKETPNK